VEDYKTLIGKRDHNMPKKVQKRQDTFLRRKQIINALRKLIIKYGSEHVTVRRIAKEIGISEGAIYRHFKSKREILGFLVEYIEDNLIGDIEKSDHNKKVLELLEDILTKHLSSIEQRKGVSFLVIAEIISLGDKKLNNKIFNVLNNYMSKIKEILLRGMKNEEIRQDINLDTTAIFFFSMIQGLVSMWYLGDYNFNLEEKYISSWSIFCEAIKKR
jgi:AcrR family transcriptional regulator